MFPKYRIVEKADGWFYIQERFLLFFYVYKTNFFHQEFKPDTLVEAKTMIDRWNHLELKEKLDSQTVKVHKVD
jgi:hypothetical protein